MIPLTRAIDTLVINVGKRSSSIKDLLGEIHAKNLDYIEWIVL